MVSKVRKKKNKTITNKTVKIESDKPRRSFLDKRKINSYASVSHMIQYILLFGVIFIMESATLFEPSSAIYLYGALTALLALEVIEYIFGTEVDN